MINTKLWALFSVVSGLAMLSAAIFVKQHILMTVFDFAFSAFHFSLVFFWISLGRKKRIQIITNALTAPWEERS